MILQDTPRRILMYHPSIVHKFQCVWMTTPVYNPAHKGATFVMYNDGDLTNTASASIMEYQRHIKPRYTYTNIESKGYESIGLYPSFYFLV